MTVTTGARVTSLRLDVFRFDLEHVLLERAQLQLGAELARDHRRGSVSTCC
jgi:hypothetical protein